MIGKTSALIGIVLAIASAAVVDGQTVSPPPTISPSPGVTPTPSPSTPPLPGQTPPPGATPTPSPTPTPAPYTADEFPPWLVTLRRSEIIFFGSLPFSFLFAFEGVEIGRYVASGYDPNYSPWPVRSANPPPYSGVEQAWIIGSAFVISAVAAAVDFIIGLLSPPPASQ